MGRIRTWWVEGEDIVKQVVEAERPLLGESAIALARRKLDEEPADMAVDTTELLQLFEDFRILRLQWLRLVGGAAV